MRYLKVAISGILIFFQAFVIGPGSLQAQEKVVERSSEDSLRCLKLFSVYSLALQKKMHDYAVGPWRLMFQECPDMSTRIYSDGVGLMTHYMKQEKDQQKKEALVDTILMIYDQRITYFGDHKKYPEGWILGRKGLEIVKYRRNSPEALQEAYDCFEKSYKLMGQRSEPPVLLAWMQTTRSLFAKELISSEDVYGNFIRIHMLVTDQIANEQKASKKALGEKILSAVENVFKHTGISDCEFFTSYLGDQKAVNQMEPSEIKRNIHLLEVTECIDSDLYVALVEQDYKNNPDAVAASQLARLFLKRNGYENAKKYYLEAIDKSDVDTLKGVYCYELGVLAYGHFGQVEMARRYARKAASLKSEWGAPYMLLGSIYAQKATKMEGDEFQKQTVYWVAVDQFLKALKTDTSFLEEAKKQIDIYSQYFPDQQSCFFNGLEEGQAYEVGNWIKESTVVRYRK